MDDLLFLCHRIPYPPDKGDKIRSWNMLRHLARRYRVHLGAFVDDPANLDRAAPLLEHCADSCLVPLRRWRAGLRCAAGLVAGEPLTLSWFGDPVLRAWVARVCDAHRPSQALAFSSAMAPYLMALPRRTGRQVLDLVDVDSDKWRQLAQRAVGPRRTIYAREARRLLAFERRAARHFDASLLVSEAEAELFRRLAPDSTRRIQVVENGVDCAHFDPGASHANPFPGGGLPLVFTGAMDYWPNVDAVAWFARRVLPLLRQRGLPVTLHIVGAKPVPEVRALERLNAVKVTGRVPDVRPYLAHAAAVVAPLRVARGVQNKVLEAMAMARPVVASPQAVRALSVVPGRDLVVADGAAAFAAAVVGIVGGGGDGLGAAARAHVLRHHLWRASLARLDAILEGGLAAPAASRAS